MTKTALLAYHHAKAYWCFQEIKITHTHTHSETPWKENTLRILLKNKRKKKILLGSVKLFPAIFSSPLPPNFTVYYTHIM